MVEKTIGKREIYPVFFMGCLLVFIHSLALLTIAPFEAAGVEPAFEKPDDPMNLVVLFGLILIVTVSILLIGRYWKKQLIRVIILAAVGYTSFYVFFHLLTLVTSAFASLFISAAGAFLLVVILFEYPEWYVIDFCGVIVGAGAIAIFGISLDISLVIILLLILAVYDAISVYKTKHMIDLADTVMDLKLPILLVVPKIKGYSFIAETKSFKEKIGEERDAFFMGLGDVVMPGILAATVYRNDGLPVALSVMFGTLVGFLVLMTFVIRGKPQAGLPCLCGGAILGYFVSSFVFLGGV
jgi:presenilin-like A22 family membrane protease